MSKRNGRRAAKVQERKMEKQEEIQEERDRRQRKNSIHQSQVQLSQQELQQKKDIYLEQLMQTDMSDAGIEMLNNMIDRTFVLGNITEAEYHDIKWFMRVIYLKIKANFPPKESEITGDVRAFVLDDKSENLDPLTGQQKTIIMQMVKGITVLVSRSKDGFQQEMNVKSINVSEVMDHEQDDDDQKLGLFT